ncbi:MAG: mechanosensitive ion channel [Deltaproteobacteria bacterium]|nr:mechanosensitive ion channel [Deltaproteobacteria bacterium]MBW2362092.1 mechanosensitive ion channel [Deltaproteobacteria bacterium]
MQIDPEAMQDFALTLLPTVVTLLSVGIALALANRLLLGRAKAREPEGQMGRQLVMLALSVVGLIAIILALPLDTTRQGQLLSLLGLLLSGAIALSSTNLLGNIMSGLMLRAVQNFRLGDFIEVAQEFGRVSERGLFHVEIQTPLRQFTTLPNTFLVNNPVRVVNATGAVVEAKISLGYEVPRRDVEQHLCAAAEQAGLEEPFARVLELGDHSVTYQVAGLLREVEKLLATRSRVNAQILDVLHDAGIEIVSPAFINQRDYPASRTFAPQPPASVPAAAPVRDEAPAEVFDKASSAALRERLEEFERRLEGAIEELERCERAGEEPPGEISFAEQIVRARRRLERVKLALEDRELLG